MKRVLLLCLIAVAVFAPNSLYLTRESMEGGVAMGLPAPSTLNCIPPTETVLLPSNQHEVHAVVVDKRNRR
jgi:hypothetical protein